MRRLIATTCLVLAAGGAVAWSAAHIYESPGPLAVSTIIVIPHGGIDDVAGALVRAGAVGSRLAFKAASLITSPQGHLHAAEFQFPARASLAAVLEMLRFGHAVQHRVTLPEGLTAAQISDVLARADGLTGDMNVPPEGSMLPDTYEYTRSTSRAAIIARAEQAMRQFLSAAWNGRATNLPLRSPRDALILASIVEREARLPAERAMIARVFMNRLAAGMRLQADPTTLYGASGGMGALDRPLTREDLAQTDSYNTYVVDGLPSGPICSPGSAAITAVLHPAAGDALYFVSDGAGGHVFANSLGVHNANVTRYRSKRR